MTCSFAVLINSVSEALKQLEVFRLLLDLLVWMLVTAKKGRALTRRMKKEWNGR